ncbi:PAS-domain containing protein [Tabrizicola sp. YIM 78059]|uniref:PAS-domain containing protein n=1 Tax=Tabrizicola sp. YIM 78059 TaxID=2529861 RepID=UPI0010AA2C48|nr:PAS-domain containing protein [Tabrizicola sp. YIM 78059]
MKAVVIEDLLAAVAMVLTATLVALASLALMAAWQMRRPCRTSSIFSAQGPAAAFLFDGDRLLDATPAARSILPEGEDGGALSRLIGTLGPLFPGLSQALDTLPRAGLIVIASSGDVQPPLVLKGEYLRGLTRLTMIQAAGDGQPGPGDGAVLAALQHEVLAQRVILARSPVVMWKEDARGQVVWANHAYLIRATELLPDRQDLSWPLPRLFQTTEPSGGRTPRISLQARSGLEWFDLFRVSAGEEVLHYALAADAAVEAETALREFMQTLTKTFADLPIGLAIFDRSRILQLFNPALADLTALSPEFLISRPTLSAVLDAMRAKAMIPEPRDYRSWRRQVMRVEEEASAGHFEETWNLPGGQTYRVIGRPHPNGALAFMFEDISSEMLRTRRYRADLELGQSVIDAVEDAVAVFSQGGQLLMSNLAYTRLWNHDPAVMLSDAGIGTLSAWWRNHSAPTLLWDDAIAFVAALGDRAPWEGEVRLLDGRLVTCRLRSLPGGATLITFRARASEAVVPVRDDIRSLLSA